MVQRRINPAMFKAVQYGVRKEDSLIDYEEVERLAKEHKPKMIIVVFGLSAHCRLARFRKSRIVSARILW